MLSRISAFRAVSPPALDVRVFARSRGTLLYKPYTRSARPGCSHPAVETLILVRASRCWRRFAAGMIWLRPPLLTRRGRAAGLIDSIGWAASCRRLPGGAGADGTVRVGRGWAIYIVGLGRRDDPAG